MSSLIDESDFAQSNREWISSLILSSIEIPCFYDVTVKKSKVLKERRKELPEKLAQFVSIIIINSNNFIISMARNSLIYMI